MKNSLKKYAIISLIFNVSLLFVYGYYFHAKTAFSFEENMAENIEILNVTLENDNIKVLDRIIDILRKKPRLRKPFLHLFETNETIVNDFKQLRDSLLNHNHIPTKDADLIFEEYNNALFGFKYCYDTGMHDVQKEAKLRDYEVEQKILNINQYAIEDPRIYKQDLKGLSVEELKALFLFMENHLVLIQTYSDNDFGAMIGGHYYFHRFFPLILPQHRGEIMIGETFEAELTIGSFFGFYQRRKTLFSVYLNNKKIDLNTDRYKFELNADSIGKQRIEAVIHWTHPDTHETGKDTTYFEYTVTP